MAASVLAAARGVQGYAKHHDDNNYPTKRKSIQKHFKLLLKITGININYTLMKYYYLLIIIVI